MGDDEAGAVLGGGGDSGTVIWVGDTVRRRVRPWTVSVHAVLRHLEVAGFDGAPRALGIDESGREVLTFIAGRDGREARCYDEAALVAVAVLIRRLHDAVRGFVAPAGSVWRPCPQAPGGGLVCHNDLSPANTIFVQGRPVAFIDWDLAVPSTSGWDLSCAARTFVPLYAEKDCIAMGYGASERARRLRVLRCVRHVRS